VARSVGAGGLKRGAVGRWLACGRRPAPL